MTGQAMFRPHSGQRRVPAAATGGLPLPEPDLPRIVTVGDSHSQRCFEDHPLIADSTRLAGCNRMDGRTAYNVIRHDRRIRKILAPLADRHLIFVFGEVDVRIHIKYQARKRGVTAGTLIRETAERYIGYVAGLRAEGYRIHVFNVVPTGDFSTPEALRWRSRLAYPFLASRAERTRYTEEMNRCLAACCRERAIPFIDIYRHLVDESGLRRDELVYDFSHLNSRTADLVMAHHDFEVNGHWAPHPHATGPPAIRGV
ncbi:MAG TPA: SGNH/GDSL hydrolase family protein [Desulfobulbus sp.]|nr:SGNH/GDSL hydrolase family protein [Desulfobulbus sp.]